MIIPRPSPLIRRMRQLLGKLTGGAQLVYHNANPTWFRSSHTDHILVHNDNVRKRRVSYILHLGSKSTSNNTDDAEWSLADGGHFVWCQGGIHAPTFNTLTVFSVSSATYHLVAPVWSSHVQRLAISGFYLGEDAEVENWHAYSETLPPPQTPGLFVTGMT